MKKIIAAVLLLVITAGCGDGSFQKVLNHVDNNGCSKVDFTLSGHERGPYVICREKDFNERVKK